MFKTSFSFFSFDLHNFFFLFVPVPTIFWTREKNVIIRLKEDEEESEERDNMVCNKTLANPFTSKGRGESKGKGSSEKMSYQT